MSAVYASEEGGKAALLKSAPETVGSIQASLDDETRSSIAFLCSMARAVPSRSLPAASTPATLRRPPCLQAASTTADAPLCV